MWVEDLFFHVQNGIPDELVFYVSICLPNLTTLTVTSGEGFITGQSGLDIPTVVELRLNVQEGMDDMVAQFPNAQAIAYPCSTVNNSHNGPNAAQQFSAQQHDEVPRPACAEDHSPGGELWDVFSRRKLLAELDVTILLRDWATPLGKVYRQHSASSLTLVRASEDEDVVLSAALLLSFVQRKTSFVPNTLRCIVLAGFLIDDPSAFGNLGTEVRVEYAWGERSDDEFNVPVDSAL
ncbi:hypothetical protein EXIGLDRAFT_708301 [Exidia glandulosa HHB12029]|uniref:Uncharacterized protein n=1 Tax=Exidia glandulosa HHB12029 TaxID=1314781 RepID=A0A166N762_EXIGL|nr:hypothetical protein EXIGLDRAFT_708301 [Exidia glandulosa HHB12029]